MNAKRFLSRTGVIFSNMAIFSTVVAVAAFAAGIAYALYVLVALLVILFLVLVTLFLILAIHPDIFSVVNADGASAVINFLMAKVSPVAAVVALITCALSIIFLCLSEPKKYKGRIVFSCVVLVICAVLVVAIGVSAKGRE